MNNFEWYTKESKKDMYDMEYIFGKYGRMTDLFPGNNISLIICTFPEASEEILQAPMNEVKAWAEENFNIEQFEMTDRNISFIGQFDFYHEFRTNLQKLEKIEIPFSVLTGKYDLAKGIEYLYVRKSKDAPFEQQSERDYDETGEYDAYGDYEDALSDYEEEDCSVIDPVSGKPFLLNYIPDLAPDFSNEKIQVKKGKVNYAYQARLELKNYYVCLNTNGKITVKLDEITDYRIHIFHLGEHFLSTRPVISDSEIYQEDNSWYLTKEAFIKYKNLYEKLIAEEQKKIEEIEAEQNRDPKNVIREVVIPEGTIVIKEKEFKDYKNLETVILPESIKEIGNFAFCNCVSLRNINFPSRLKKIGDGAFAVCRELEEIILPDSVVKLGKAAFNECSNVQKLVLSKSIKEIPEECFSGCKLTELNIPDSVRIIKKRAFAYLDIETLVIPKNVKRVTSYAFTLCSKLKTVTIKRSLFQRIKRGAFYHADKSLDEESRKAIIKISPRAFRYSPK